VITARITAGEWEAIGTVAKRLGMTPETLRKWIRQAEIDEGAADGTTTDAARQIRELKRKNAELERTVEILKAATTFFRPRARLRNSADVLVHRCTQAGLRRRAWEERSDGVCRVLTEHEWGDRTEDLLRPPDPPTVHAGAVGQDHHQGARLNLHSSTYT
jgi:transposase